MLESVARFSSGRRRMANSYCFDSFFDLLNLRTAWYLKSIISILSRTVSNMIKNSRGRRGRPANEALGQTIVSTAGELFAKLGFQATTLDKVARRAKISKLSIYRHFENKEALFSAAIAARCRQFAPQAVSEGVEGSAEDQLMAVGTSLLRTLLSPDVRSVEAMVGADKTNQKSLSKLFYEAGPANVIAEIESLLRQLHEKTVLHVPDPHWSARLFGALFKGSDLLMIAGFDEAKATDDNEIEAYCRSAVTMFIAAHRSNNTKVASLIGNGQNEDPE
jgi:TetR/AcrR family transcriptional regulator, mexJK operon transcriptional repressor